MINTILDIVKLYLDGPGISVRTHQFVNRSATSLILCGLCVVFAGFCIGFGSLAAYIALGQSVGTLAAALILSVVSLLLAVGAWYSAGRVFAHHETAAKPAPPVPPPLPILPLIDAAGAVLKTKATTVSLIALTSGFVVGLVLMAQRPRSGTPD